MPTRKATEVIIQRQRPKEMKPGLYDDDDVVLVAGWPDNQMVVIIAPDELTAAQISGALDRTFRRWIMNFELSRFLTSEEARHIRLRNAIADIQAAMREGSGSDQQPPDHRIVKVAS